MNTHNLTTRVPQSSRIKTISVSLRGHHLLRLRFFRTAP